MKKILLSTISLALVFSLATSSVSAQIGDGTNPAPNELAEHVPGELLIRFSPWINSTQAESRMNEMGVTHKREINGIGVHLVMLPPGLSVEKAIERFSHLPGVEYVEPNYILQRGAYDVPLALVSVVVIALSLVLSYVLYVRRDIPAVV